ncbi:MAG: phosphopantetheine-binding protein, partial [Actinomycetota bacterium]|nr:phosphopantetheine-binding protein [Actinomycetota bacterium]
ETLATTGIGVDDNFFDIGGHSLLVVRMHRRLREQLDSTIALTDLYRYPTVRSFASSLASDSGAAVIQSSMDRAAKRRDTMARRRVRR